MSRLVINVNFTFAIAAEDVPRFLELAAQDSVVAARWFAKGEAEENFLTYLEDNGVPVEPIRSVARNSQKGAA